MGYRFRHGDRPLDGYTVQRGVGRGGFGEVYFAVSDAGREIALKHVSGNAEVELRGVTACMNLKSPHLVQVFDVKRNADGEYFILMEYVQGPSLRDILIAEPTGLGPQKAAFFVREIGKGLSYLHDRGIVHRDLKPGNIFYEDGYVKIGDYGLSKYISTSRHSGQTASVGTVHYMAPEVGSGDYSRCIDIYALGVMLYEMLLGKVPYEGSSMGEVLMKHLTAQPEVDELPQPFGEVIRKALAKDPNDRFQSVDEMTDALLGVDAVRDSIAGFDAASLSGMVRKAMTDEPASPGVQTVTTPGGGRPGLPPIPEPAFARPVGPGAGMPAPRSTAFSGPSQPTPEAAAGRVLFAGFWVRFAAAMLDFLIVGAAAGILAGGSKDNPAFFILMVVYQGILHAKWNGQTLGKKVFGLRVMAESGHYCSLGRSFGRAAAEFINIFTLGIGWIMAAWDDESRALHDRIAGTRCIRALFEVQGQGQVNNAQKGYANGL